jgi:hypothetical protein
MPRRTSTKRSGEELTIAQSCCCNRPANGAGRFFGETRTPGTGEIGLEHVARAQMLVYARHAIEKQGRGVLLDDFGYDQWRDGRLDAKIRLHRIQPCGLPCFSYQHGSLVQVIDDDRCRTAQRQRNGQAFPMRQVQGWLDFRSQLIGQQQYPAAMEGQAVVGLCG